MTDRVVLDVTAARAAAAAAVATALAPLMDAQSAQLVKTTAAQQRVSEVLDELAAALKAAQADSPLTQPDRYPDLPAYARKIEDLRRRLAQVGSSLGATFQRLDYLQEALTDFARTQAAAQRLAMQAEQQAAAAATAASSAEAAEPGAADRAHPAPIVGDAVPA